MPNVRVEKFSEEIGKLVLNFQSVKCHIEKKLMVTVFFYILQYSFKIKLKFDIIN